MSLEITQEIAQAAAQLMADDDLDWSQARSKAIVLLGADDLHASCWPDAYQIETELISHLSLFEGEIYTTRLLQRRRQAQELMLHLQAYEPYLTGPVAWGTATRHSEIVLQVFLDQHKDLMIELINQGLKPSWGEVRHYRGKGEVEALRFAWQDTSVLIACYPHHDLRGALKPDAHGRVRRMDLKALNQLLAGEADATN